MHSRTIDFLARHGMSPELTQPLACAEPMLRDMWQGLRGKGGSMAMIPTYLSNDGVVAPGSSAVVIDAGGTNFRTALLSFTEDGYTIDGLKKQPMPGIGKPCTWEEFVCFVADNVEPFMDRADVIGFCFSYSAVIMPDMDGKVIRIDKEVVVSGSEGKMVGASLSKELARRGYPGKRVVVLNDTVAVLLGGAASVDKSAYSGFIGQVSGTGTNTCATVARADIEKLGLRGAGSMIINLESGQYNGFKRGDFDLELDAMSNNPGEKQMEKLTAGVYLGQLCRLMLRSAADEGLLSEEGAEKVRTLGSIDSAVIDAWASGEGYENIGEDEGDRELARELSLALFERSARCMCTNLVALSLLMDAGREKPVCVLAEGSLVQRGRHYRPVLERLLKECGETLGISIELHVGNDTTQPGSAAAALLNLK